MEIKSEKQVGNYQFGKIKIKEVSYQGRTTLQCQEKTPYEFSRVAKFPSHRKLCNV